MRAVVMADQTITNHTNREDRAMMIFALWYGGANYSAGEIDRDLETFPSISAAREALVSRTQYGHWQTQDFAYADGRTDRVLTPCADASPTMTVWKYDPRGEADPYPDALIEYGPRGGVRVLKV